MTQYNYQEDIRNLIETNRELRPFGRYFAFSGSGFLYSSLDPTWPYGIIRNGDGRWLDVLDESERLENPLPEGWKRLDGIEVGKV